jgi:hypothetical protein
VCKCAGTDDGGDGPYSSRPSSKRFDPPTLGSDQRCRLAARSWSVGEGGRGSRLRGTLSNYRLFSLLQLYVNTGVSQEQAVVCDAKNLARLLAIFGLDQILVRDSIHLLRRCTMRIGVVALAITITAATLRVAAQSRPSYCPKPPDKFQALVPPKRCDVILLILPAAIVGFAT